MVLVAKGIHATILASKETTWGTYVSPTKSVGLVQSFGTDLDGSVTETFALGQAKSVSVDAGNVKPGGSTEVLMSKPLQIVRFFPKFTLKKQDPKVLFYGFKLILT